MKNELKSFTNITFGSIRGIEINGESWLVGKDVAEVLGYKNTRDALIKHVDDEDKNTVAIHDGSQNRNMTVINESGFYSLALSSKLPNAKKFKRWVTSEVLPQIRQTGGYIPTKEEESDEEFLARALLVAQRTLEKKNKELEEKNKVIEEQKPKVEFYDKVLNPTDEENGFTKLLTTTEVAKDLGMTARQLNNILHEKRKIYKKGKTWVLYSKYDHLISEKYCDYFINEFGNLLKWTEKGRKFIIELLEK